MEKQQLRLLAHLYEHGSNSVVDRGENLTIQRKDSDEADSNQQCSRWSDSCFAPAGSLLHWNRL